MRSTCSMPGCDKNVNGRGLCNTHYQRLARHGDPSITVRIRHTGDDSERFWKRVEKSDGCWLWTGLVARNGYGKYGLRDRSILAHRFAYAEITGPIPEGYQLDHTCHNRACVRPEHLRLATNKQNNENPSGLRSDNTSGYRGVLFNKRVGRWYAVVQHNNRTHSGGGYATAEEAAEAARQLRLRLFTHNDEDRRTA